MARIATNRGAASKGPYEGIPPLRDETFESDDFDDERVEYCVSKWEDQDLLLRRRDRQVEENIRMLAGQQWMVFSKLFGRFIDLREVLEERERRWRQRPVVNRLLYWYMLLHARLTENPPIITFQAATGDRDDAKLAELMDTLNKILWRQIGMLEVHDQAAGWLIPGGRVYLKSRVDPNLGDLLEWRGPAMLQLLAEDGSVVEGPEGPIERPVPDVPYDQHGRPQARLTDEGGEWEPTGKAFAEREGGLDVQVLSAMEARGQWGPVPWQDKRWHMQKAFLTPEEVWDTYQVEVKPEIVGEEAHAVGSLRQALFGSGYYGATAGDVTSHATHDRDGSEGYVEVFELWHAPSQFPGMQESPDEPGGRLLVTTRNDVLRDGQRPARFKYTSPIRCWDFVFLPGRPSGTTPQEAMNPIQRQYNRGWGQILEHVNLMSNPKIVADRSQGIETGDITNEPGEILHVNRSPYSKAPPIEFVKPANLGREVFDAQGLLKGEMQDLGSMEGAEGRVPTADASGELVKELRFNADRFIGPTQRRGVIMYSRMVEDWMAIIPTIWDREKVFTFTGRDQTLRTITVWPELFRDGKVSVVPEIESMLPEGRGERQSRIRRMWQEGAFGDPQSPAAIRHYLELARFPHMGRAVRPGGPHRLMAEQENTRLAQGIPADELPIYEWQDAEVHLATHEEFMAGPDFQGLPRRIQEQFAIHRQMTIQALESQEREAMVAAGEQAATAAEVEAATAAAAEDAALSKGVVPGAAGQPGHAPESVQAGAGGPPGMGPAATAPGGGRAVR